jgi:hypothetical protein
MAAKDKAEAAATAAREAGRNPYLQRVIQDQELRDNMIVAAEAARNAYSRLSNGKAPAKALLDDKKLHKELKRTSDALRDASAALKDAPKRSQPKSRKKGGIGKLLLLTIIGGAVAMAASEGLRNKVLDALFGAEEEFDYSSNTTPASPPEGASG